MVIQELIRVIQASIGNMKRYPKLRHEIESVMCNFIRETEQNCKDHVRMLINCELACSVTDVHLQLMHYRKACQGFSCCDQKWPLFLKYPFPNL